jgi:hypothetical protein
MAPLERPVTAVGGFAFDQRGSQHCGGRLEEVVGLGSGEHRFHLRPELLVTSTGTVQKRRPLLRREVEYAIQDPRHLRPTIGRIWS